jgi:hypothetical protein
MAGTVEAAAAPAQPLPGQIDLPEQALQDPQGKATTAVAQLTAPAHRQAAVVDSVTMELEVPAKVLAAMVAMESFLHLTDRR